MSEHPLVEEVLAGDHRALARAITTIENRESGYRNLVAGLHEHTGEAEIVGITGSPGSGKSTLVDRLAAAYREQGLTVGVVAVDPSSPFTGGAVLGDRIRMGSTVGDMDVFVRSMSARGSLGGVSTATADAVKALDAFGKDRILVETVGAGQNEVDIVRTADTVAVLVPPGSGDDVQMLKAGILEIGDVFVVNKADLPGADRTVQELREALDHGGAGVPDSVGYHGPDAAVDGFEPSDDGVAWDPIIVETVASKGEGIEDLLDAFRDHAEFLDGSGERERTERARFAAEIRRLLREDLNRVLAAELDRQGGLDAVVERVADRETDPYTVADELLDSVRDRVEGHEE